MGRPISYFTGYHGKENLISNYCGVMLKMVYDDSIRSFEEIINAILSTTDASFSVGTIFTQQEKCKNSIPDLTIKQNSFKIIVENKTKDWFYEDQLKRHITSFDKNSSLNLLILLCDEYIDDKVVNKVRRVAKSKNAHIAAVTYEDLLCLIENNTTSDFIKTQLVEFKDFLNQQGLLLNWRNRLDVVNCASSSVDLGQDLVYMCPDTGGAYSHQRAKYFGEYKNKEVGSIYTIEAVVSVAQNVSNVDIKWKNDTEKKDSELKRLAAKYVRKYRANENQTVQLQVFILENKRSVKFIKDTSGGLYGSKVYFDDIANDCNSIDDLVKKIDNRTWSEFRG